MSVEPGPRVDGPERGAAPRQSRALSESVIVVTPRSFGMDDPTLKAELEARVSKVVYVPGPLSSSELSAAVQDADGLIAGLDDITAAVFEGAPKLQVVARYGVGTDRVDLPAAERCGVIVTTTPGVNANAVAELTVALLFAVARPLVQGRQAARGEKWPALRGIELAGRVLGIVGMGRIGSLVATKGSALGMKVLGYDPYREVHPAALLVDMVTLLSRSDFVTLHAPLMDSTRGMMGRPQFETMRAGAVLINTARGALVDEAALLWALENGRLRAAALDVMVEEPPSAANVVGRALLQRDDVIVTPHMGPHTKEATSAMGRLAVEDVLAVLSGEPPQHAVTRSSMAAGTGTSHTQGAS